ncbi:unnamed protein product [Rotaria sp. Silwood2]|nr:unnamed protein product [Rotaria sp. Silwood2]
MDYALNLDNKQYGATDMVPPIENVANPFSANCSIPERISVYIQTSKVISGFSKSLELSNPSDIFLDENRNLYVVDSDNNRILKYSPDSLNGRVVTGNVSSSDEDSTFPELRNPIAIFVDKNEHLYIVDHYIEDVYRIIFWPNNSKDDLVIVNSTNSSCYGIYSDQNLNIFASAYLNHRVVKWLAPLYQEYIIVVANGTGSSKQTQLKNPEKIHLNLFTNDLYIIDNMNSRIIKWSLDLEDSIIVTEDLSPVDLMTDCHNNIYVLDKKKGSVRYYGSVSMTGLEGVEVIQLSSYYQVDLLSSSGLSLTYDTDDSFNVKYPPNHFGYYSGMPKNQIQISLRCEQNSIKEWRCADVGVCVNGSLSTRKCEPLWTSGL